MRAIQIHNFGQDAGLMLNALYSKIGQRLPKHSVSRIFIFALCAITFALIPTISEAKANKKYASIVIDADTGTVLHERHANKKLHPASLTKIMTLLMAFEALEQGKINHNTRLRVSRHAASMVPSKLDLKPGSSIKVKDAIYILVTKSANDVAVAMGEHLGGSEKNFARLMTRKAQAIGMRNTTFRNASGLHHPQQISTARDMAILGQYVINAYPEYYRYFSKQNYTYKGKNYRNHNRLLGKYQGMDGLKTGFVNASGFNLVASAVRNNRRIIGVVFGGRSGKTRNAHMASLLDKGFGRVNSIRVAKARVPLPPRKPAILSAVAALQNTQTQPSTQSRTASQDSQNIKLASMGKLIGEGDYELDQIARIETGLIAIAAHTGQRPKIIKAKPNINVQPAHLRPSIGSKNGWAVQIGAFTSRAATDEMLNDGLRKLPSEFSNVSPVIAPLKTKDGWLFRGRLGGMNKTEALAACGYFQECLTIAPQNY